MHYNPKPLRMLLINHSKIEDSFQTTLTNLESRHSITIFKDVKLCLQHLKKAPKVATPILFFNLNDTTECKLLTEIVSVRNDKKNKDLPIVVYNSKQTLFDEETFIAGANISIKKSRDVLELKKVLKKVINIYCHFESGKFNRETFFVSV